MLPVAITSRAEREKRAYDDGTLRRSRYEQLFQRSTVDTQFLSSVIREHMAYAQEKAVLEIGSNAWIGYLHHYNIRPRHLDCINISQRELDLGIEYQRKNSVEFPITFSLMDGNEPSFGAEQFDLVFGGAILHHLDLAVAIKNIARIVKPGGKILFHEPLGTNPAAKLVRLLTPSARTRDERPLSLGDLREISRYFRCAHYTCGGTSTAVAVVTSAIAQRSNTLVDKCAARVDQALAKIPPLALFYREIIISGTKRDS